MITAHGTSDKHREALRKSALVVADGTCPLVRYAHEQLKRLVQAGYFPVVIGLAITSKCAVWSEILPMPLSLTSPPTSGIFQRDRVMGLFPKRLNQSIAFAHWSGTSRARIQALRFDSQTRFANRQKIDSSR
jgi:hypothetical protein